MNKAEFIKMLRQDNETMSEPKKTLFNQVIECTVIALLDEDDDFEVDAKITIEDLWGLIEKKGSASPAHCVGPFEAADLIAEHLHTHNSGTSRLYKMVMGTADSILPTPRRSRISLDDI